MAEVDNKNNHKSQDEDSQRALSKESKPTKKKNIRPPRTFPQNDLKEALAIANAIAEHNAGNPWDSEQNAVAVDTAFKSTNFYYLTAASRDFGLTTGTRRSKTVELTSLGRKIVYPKDVAQEHEALMEAFMNIDIFKSVYDYYSGGKLPEERYLFNTLQENFGLDACYHEEFLKIYLKSLEFLKQKEALSSLPLQSTDTLLKPLKTSSDVIIPKANPSQKNKIFVIMPFSEKTDSYPKGYFDEVFNSLIVPAASDAGYIAQTANKKGSDIIHKTIVNNIYHAEIILADLTEHNPNVLFELGLAIAFKKKVAIIRARGTSPIFDVDNSMRVLDYNPNLWKSTLEMDIGKLSQHIQATVSSDESTYLDIFLS